ncbi:RHS repeat domain-containing protein [Akkermansia glycaniphila]|uniref:Rhs protein signature n=2 Tax=Akkermansia glycaniphila TaxID=1679444 RepID=A0A1H6M2H6_9BACT|nr:RHS repeat-associated core domain-containing protein [Akkermansia glycaniphila]SEH91561.1 rhs protein signature [Akkermansia glycaniphila]
MSSQQSPLHPSPDFVESEADLAMNGYLPEGWAPFIPGDANTAAFALTEHAADSSSSDSDSSSSSDDSSSSDWDDSSSSDDDSSSSDWDDSSSDDNDKPDTENDQFCNTCACTCACGKDNVASESFFTENHLGSTQDVAMNIVFGIEPDIAGWCPATFQILDLNPHSTSWHDPDMPLIYRLGFVFQHVTEWSIQHDPYSKIITVVKPSGKTLHYQYAGGKDTAERVGDTRQYSSLVQILNADKTPCKTGTPVYADFTTADGASIRFNVPTATEIGKPVQLVTADRVVVDLAAYGSKMRLKKDFGLISGIWHHLDGLLNIRETEIPAGNGTAASSRIVLEWYPKNQVTPSGDWYATTGMPGKTWTLEENNATQEGKTYRHLAMTAVRPGSPVTRVDRYLAADETVIDMPTGEGDRRIRYSNVRTIQSDGTWEHLTTRRMTSGDTTPTSSTRQIYKLIDGIWQETSRTEGYGTSLAQTTTYTYAGPRLSRVDFHDGGYRSYAYDDKNRLIMEASPWSGGTNSNNFGQGEQITTTSYADLRFNDYRPSSVSTAIRMPGTTGTELSKETYSYTDTDLERSITVKKTALGSDLEQTSASVYYGPDVLPPMAAGRVKMSQGINGVQTFSSYAATTEHNAVYCIITEQQVDNQPVAGQSTRTVSYIAEDGMTTCTETYAHTGSEWSLLTRETYEYNIYRNRTKTVKANGRMYSTEWMCCAPLREIDEDGVVTTYSYNAAHQLIETIRSATAATPETIVSYTRDAAGRAIATRTDIGPMTTTTSVVYDVLGRTVSTTDELGRTTGYEYSVDGLTETVTSPTGATTVTSRDCTEKIESITGSAQQAKKYESYLLLNDLDTSGLETRSYIKHEGNWFIVSKTLEDGFGHTIREQQKAVNQNDEFITTSSQYNAKGQLVRQQIFPLAPIELKYDVMGNQTKQTTVLVDEGIAPTPANSRITEQTSIYTEEKDGIYHTKKFVTYNAEGQALRWSKSSLVSELDAELASKTVTIDIRGYQSEHWSHYSAAAQTISYMTKPGCMSVFSQTKVDGFIIQTVDHAGIVTNMRRQYIAAGLIMTAIDARNNTHIIEYDMAGRPVKTIDEQGNTTSTVYDTVSDNPACITDAQGTTTCYRYDHRSRKTAQYGTAVQPIVWSYTDDDQISSMWTWRDPHTIIETDPTGLIHQPEAARTVWTYNPATGLLLQKQYADNRKDEYYYDSLNRLISTLDARDIGKRYTYDSRTGEVIAIESGDSTPSITYSYNHLGQPARITDAAGTRTFHYNQYGEVESEQTEGLVDSIVTLNRDAYGRASGYNLTHQAMSLDSVDYAYDSTGRLAFAAGFAYAYDTESGLLSHILYPSGLRCEHTWHPDLDIVTDIRYNGLNVQTALHPDRYRYDYDSLLRPVSQSDYRNVSTKPTVTRTYAYNNRSELTRETATDGSRHAYAYDNIGNRITAQNNATATSYEANLVNQYSKITTQGAGAFTPAYDAAGNQTLIRTASGTWNAQYNADNRPVSFQQGDRRIDSVYDYMGRRIEKSIWEKNALTKRLRHIYHGYVQIAEIDATDEAAPFVTKTYRWSPTATRPLALFLWTREGNVRETLYYAHDLRKNVVSLFDAKGLRRASYQYDPYGNITSMEGDMAEINPFRFSSEHHDEDLGLVYYNYRHYNPMDGRWVSRDPIAEQGGYNLYGFVDNNSIRYADVLALWKQDTANEYHWKAETNDSFSSLVQKLGLDDSEKDCIFPISQDALDAFPKLVVGGLYDTSRLSTTPEKNEVLFCMIFDPKFGLSEKTYGMSVTYVRSMDLARKLREVSQNGRKPITKLILVGHGDVMQGCLTPSKDKVERKEAFSFKSMLAEAEKQKKKKPKSSQNDIYVHPKCWFAPGAQIVLGGCKTKGMAHSWLGQCGRNGCDIMGTSQLLVYSKNNGAMSWITQSKADRSGVEPNTPQMQKNATPAGKWETNTIWTHNRKPLTPYPKKQQQNSCIQ